MDGNRRIKNLRNLRKFSVLRLKENFISSQHGVTGTGFTLPCEATKNHDKVQMYMFLRRNTSI